jgi:hypothetical protein
MANGRWVERKRLMRFFRLGEENCPSISHRSGPFITSDFSFDSMNTSWLTIVLLVFSVSRIQGQVSQSGAQDSPGFD